MVENHWSQFLKGSQAGETNSENERISGHNDLVFSKDSLYSKIVVIHNTRIHNVQLNCLILGLSW